MSLGLESQWKKLVGNTYGGMKSPMYLRPIYESINTLLNVLVTQFGNLSHFKCHILE